MEGLGSWFSTTLNQLDEALGSEMIGAYLKRYIFRQVHTVQSTKPKSIPVSICVHQGELFSRE